MRPVGIALAETTYRPVSPEVKVPQQGTLTPRHHTRGDHRGNVHGLRSDVLWIHDIGRAPSHREPWEPKAKLEAGAESGIIFLAPPPGPGTSSCETHRRARRDTRRLSQSRHWPCLEHIFRGGAIESIPLPSRALLNVTRSRQHHFRQLERIRTRHDDHDDDTSQCSEPGSEKKGRRQSSSHAIFTEGPSILSKPGCITSQSAGRPRDKPSGDCVSTPEPNELSSRCCLTDAGLPFLRPRHRLPPAKNSTFTASMDASNSPHFQGWRHEAGSVHMACIRLGSACCRRYLPLSGLSVRRH